MDKLKAFAALIGAFVLRAETGFGQGKQSRALILKIRRAHLPRSR